jgi:hypothetical protein
VARPPAPSTVLPSSSGSPHFLVFRDIAFLRLAAWGSDLKYTAASFSAGESVADAPLGHTAAA